MLRVGIYFFSLILLFTLIRGSKSESEFSSFTVFKMLSVRIDDVVYDMKNLKNDLEDTEDVANNIEQRIDQIEASVTLMAIRMDKYEEKQAKTLSNEKDTSLSFNDRKLKKQLPTLRKMLANEKFHLREKLEKMENRLISFESQFESNMKKQWLLMNDSFETSFDILNHSIADSLIAFEKRGFGNQTGDLLQEMSSKLESKFIECETKIHKLLSAVNLTLHNTSGQSNQFDDSENSIGSKLSKDCTCKENETCIEQDNEKKCIRGKYCVENTCQNGGTCINTGSTQTCYCPTGFRGETCLQSKGVLSFIKAPVSRTLKRGQSHIEECKVDVPEGADIVYDWSFEGTLIQNYTKNEGFGVHPGGILQIDTFSDELVGQYLCLAQTSTETVEHTFEYRIAEDCDVRIFPGPQSETKKIDEMVLLMCHVDSRAKEVRWMKDGVYIDYSRDERIKKMSNNYLYIKQVEMRDEGTYRCEAEDKNGCYTYKEGKLRVKNVKALNEYCGVSVYDESVLMTSRITKGSDALPNKNPWHVTIRTRGVNTKASRHIAFCGGTLISQRFVVTAAHCIIEMGKVFGAPFVAENVELLLGTTDCLGTKHDGIRRTVQNYTVHPNYEHRSLFDNDIALIELDSPVQYTDIVRPICVEPAAYNDRVFLENSRSLQSVSGRVAGCGVTGRGMSKTLQEVYIPYVQREQCLESLGKRDGRLTDTMFCAGSDKSRTGDSCSGDGGGGLIMATSRRWVLTGIVSWSTGGCDVDRYFGVYTNVGMFYDWIDQITKFSEEEGPDFMDDE